MPKNPNSKYESPFVIQAAKLAELRSKDISKLRVKFANENKNEWNGDLKIKEDFNANKNKTIYSLADEKHELHQGFVP